MSNGTVLCTQPGKARDTQQKREKLAKVTCPLCVLGSSDGWETQEIRMFDSVCMEWAVRNLHQKLVHIVYQVSALQVTISSGSYL